MAESILAGFGEERLLRGGKISCIRWSRRLLWGQMILPVVTKDPTAVEAYVQATYLAMFPRDDRRFVPRVFSLAVECFGGHRADYQAVDARYHDFEHTLQGTVCMARLLHARQCANGHRPVTQRLFQLGIIGILLHDTGYLKKHGDTEGSGAKYTTTHVNRSTEFAGQLLHEEGFAPADIAAVQRMIRCTDVEAVLNKIPFRCEQEKMVGRVLATADLLGQMSADDYVDKLPILYAELAEAALHDGRPTEFIAKFKCADDLVRRTPAFWYEFVLPKLDRDFGGLHSFLNDPYPDGPNEYVRRIEANIERIREMFGSAKTSTTPQRQIHSGPTRLALSPPPR